MYKNETDWQREPASGNERAGNPEQQHSGCEDTIVPRRIPTLTDDLTRSFISASALRARAEGRWNSIVAGNDGGLWINRDWQRHMHAETVQHVAVFEAERRGWNTRRLVFQCMNEALNTQLWLLAKHRGIRAEDFVEQQAFLQKAFNLPTTKRQIMYDLSERALLSPEEEIHWRVDRDEPEVERRVGVRLPRLMDDVISESSVAHPHRKPVVAESGSGNGTSKKQRSERHAGRCIDIAVCDKLYYPLRGLIANMIDFEKLDPTLSEQQKAFISDFIAKILRIRAGETDKEDFNYDQEFWDDIRRDPESLLRYMDAKMPSLRHVDCVPSTISQHRSGRAVYPYKIERPQDPNDPVCRALDRLSADHRAYHKNTPTVREHIPMFAPGVFIGDFQAVENLDDDQVDLWIASRSHVYKRGKEYVKLMCTIASKLSDTGVLVCDSIRDNDGSRYRFAEWLQIQNMLNECMPDIQIGVVIGPAFEREDFYQGDCGVPLAVVMTQSAGRMEYFRDPENLLPRDVRTGADYRFCTLDEACADDNHLRLLDPEGAMLDEVRTTQESFLAPSNRQ